MLIKIFEQFKDISNTSNYFPFSKLEHSLKSQSIFQNAIRKAIYSGFEFLYYHVAVVSRNIFFFIRLFLESITNIQVQISLHWIWMNIEYTYNVTLNDLKTCCQCIFKYFMTLITSIDLIFCKCLSLRHEPQIYWLINQEKMLIYSINCTSHFFLKFLEWKMNMICFEMMNLIIKFIWKFKTWLVFVQCTFGFYFDKTNIKYKHLVLNWNCNSLIETKIIIRRKFCDKYPIWSFSIRCQGLENHVVRVDRTNQL